MAQVARSCTEGEAHLGTTHPNVDATSQLEPSALGYTVSNWNYHFTHGFHFERLDCRPQMQEQLIRNTALVLLTK